MWQTLMQCCTKMPGNFFSSFRTRHTVLCAAPMPFSISVRIVLFSRNAVSQPFVKLPLPGEKMLCTSKSCLTNETVCVIVTV